MDKQDILKRLIQILQQAYDIDTSLVQPSSTLAALGIDSMLSADLMIEIEDAMDFTFTNMELPRDATVQDVVDLVQLNLESQDS